MSMLGVPYSPMVPSLTRWQSGLCSCHMQQLSSAEGSSRGLQATRVRCAQQATRDKALGALA